MLAAVVARVAQRVIHRLLAALDIVGAENREAVHARARQLMRALTLLAYGVAALASISLALARFGVNEPQWNPRLLGPLGADPRRQPRSSSWSAPSS